MRPLALDVHQPVEEVLRVDKRDDSFEIEELTGIRWRSRR